VGTPDFCRSGTGNSADHYRQALLRPRKRQSSRSLWLSNTSENIRIDGTNKGQDRISEFRYGFAVAPPQNGSPPFLATDFDMSTVIVEYGNGGQTDPRLAIQNMHRDVADY
jgi:hypothetical protein